MATCTDPHNDSLTMLNNCKDNNEIWQKRECLGGYSTYRFEHISLRRPVFLMHRDGVWRTWKQHESKMKGTWEEMNATWKAMKGNENKRWHLLSVDQGCLHTQRKLEKITLLDYRELTASGKDNSKERWLVFEWLERMLGSMQSYILQGNNCHSYVNPKPSAAIWTLFQPMQLPIHINKSPAELSKQMGSFHEWGCPKMNSLWCKILTRWIIWG